MSHLVFTLALICGVLTAQAIALPFSKSSGVRELTANELPKALETHKPVFLLLYAPWCGHCKAIHPEYEKLARQTRGVVEVLAIDADQHKSIGAQYDLKGFPTVVYYGTDKKGKNKWKSYQGQRQAGAMTSAALALVETNHVTLAKDQSVLMRSLQSNKYTAVLFTQKKKTPHLLNVLAYDSSFKGVVSFYTIQDKNKELVELFQPEKYPSIAMLQLDENNLLYVKSWYDGDIEYDAIKGYVALSAEIPLPNRKETKKKSEDKTSSKKPSASPSAPQPALPVRLVEFTSGNMNLFCSLKAPLKKGQQPYCVVLCLRGPEDRSAAEELFETFKNDPFVIMYSEETDILGRLGMSDSNLHPSIAVFKEGKKGVRYVTEHFEDMEAMKSRGGALLEKISGGEQAMKKLDELPKMA